ncbi:MAG: transcriptional regulator [Puniceicoccaceae bacterium]|nr:MAG: transcriptional regulator [Puniceicoccaceae bacterium]
MKTTTMTRVTIIAEAVVAERIIEDLLRLGASGYTRTEAEGRGSRGVRASEWEGKNQKIETVVRPAVAEAVFDHLVQDYFEHFAVIAYAHPVEVVRGEKYG